MDSQGIRNIPTRHQGLTHHDPPCDDTHEHDCSHGRSEQAGHDSCATVGVVRNGQLGRGGFCIMRHSPFCEVCGEYGTRHWVTFHELDGRIVTFKLLVCCHCIAKGLWDSACRHPTALASLGV